MPAARSLLRRLARACLAPLGLELRRLPDPGAPRPGDPGSPLLALLRRDAALGLEPATVFDVGAADGTPELYAAFPRARHVLIEPLAEFAGSLEELARRHQALVVRAALGREPGRRTLHVHRDLLGSSLLEESEGPAVDGRPREVDVTTLDALVEVHALAPPFVLKIDVQGAELEVLEGARRALRDTELVLLEASLYRFFRGGPVFHELLAWMSAEGFVVHDLWGRLERPLDGTLAQTDIAFVRADGRFWRDHRFATPAQREG